MQMKRRQRAPNTNDNIDPITQNRIPPHKKIRVNSKRRHLLDSPRIPNLHVYEDEEVWPLFKVVDLLYNHAPKPSASPSTSTW